jgi:hypothetical protein
MTDVVVKARQKKVSSPISRHYPVIRDEVWPTEN